MNERVGFTQDFNVRNRRNANGEPLDNAALVRPPSEEAPAAAPGQISASNNVILQDVGAFGIKAGVPFCSLRFGKYERPSPFVSSNLAFDLIVALPLPNELQDQTGVDYSDQRLETVGDIINRGGLASTGAAALLRNSGAAFEGGVGGTADAIARVAGPVGGALATAMGNIVQTLLPAEQITSAVQQAAGLAPNPNPSVMFDGPQLREFTYSWTFMPDSEAESIAIRKFIKNVKARVLPKVTQGQSPVLFYPHMVQMNFYPWDHDGTGANPWGWGAETIIKMKKCVVKSFNVNYTPVNVPAFFDQFDSEGRRLDPTAPHPVAISCTIQLKEIEYMLSNDWIKDGEEGEFAPELDGFKVVGEIYTAFTGFGGGQ